MKNNPYAWPFSKHRQQWIASADRYCKEADELLDGVDASVSTEQGTPGWRYHRKAARIYEGAAERYLKAGVNALARVAFLRATHCWDVVGDLERRRSTSLRAKAINVYFEEEEGL
jgi:hypothetical protein